MPSIWTTPATKADQDPTLFGDWNTYVRDNMLYLYDRAANNSGIPIASATVAAAASYTFSDIPATYKHLLLRYHGVYTVTANSVLQLRFNGDSGANYDYYNAAFNTSSAVAYEGGAAQTALKVCESDALRSSSANPMSGELLIFDYTSTSFPKIARGQAATSGVYGIVSAGNWRTADVITSITIAAGSGNNIWGELALYGFNG